MPFYLSRISSDLIVILIVAASFVALLLLAFAFFFLSSHRKNPHRRSQRRIRIPAMQETVKPQRREKSESASDAEKAAVIAAVLAICTENPSERPLRVVSFRRIR